MQVTEHGKAPAFVKQEGADGYANEIRYMLECVESGRPPVTVTAHDGMTALKICEAEEQSVRTGQVVKV